MGCDEQRREDIGHGSAKGVAKKKTCLALADEDYKRRRQVFKKNISAKFRAPLCSVSKVHRFVDNKNCRL